VSRGISYSRSLGIRGFGGALHEGLHLHGEGEAAAEEMAGDGGGDRRDSETVHEDQIECSPAEEGHGAPLEGGEETTEGEEVEGTGEEVEQIKLLITVRRVRIDPDKKRAKYIRRLERLMRELDEIISDPEGVEEIQIKAMAILIRCINVCYGMVRDVEVEMLEKEVEELKRRKEGAGERALPYEIEGEEEEAAR